MKESERRQSGETMCGTGDGRAGSERVRRGCESGVDARDGGKDQSQQLGDQRGCPAREET